MTKSKVILSEVMDAIEARIPTQAAESWDSVGLVCGHPKQVFTGAVVGVDLTENLFRVALAKKANLIILHHPPLFPKGRGITRLTLGKDNDLHTLLLKCFEKKVAVYVAHTNFDRCALDGMMALANDLGGNPIARLWDSPEEGETLLKKLVTYIPMDHFEKVRDALYAVGCGHIGNYDSCGFAVPGIGNYRPLSGSSPFQGVQGELEQAEEVRFETLFPSGMEHVVIETLKYAHPYEEVAYDLYAVQQEPSKLGMVWGLGYGFVAEFKKPVSYDVFLKRVKTVFKVKHFLTQSQTPKKITRFAFTPGKGSSFLKSARSQKVDVYLTGEVGYHGSMDATRAGLNVIELGHRESEHYFLKTIESWFKKDWRLPIVAVDERTQQII